MPWYIFNGGSPNDPSNPAQYSLTASNGAAPPSCDGNEDMCGLQAVDNSGKPTLTGAGGIALKDEIIRALENNANSTNVILKSS